MAAWRYQRGSRSLALSFTAEPQQEVLSNRNEYKQKGDVLTEECEEIPSLVEEVVSQILKALRDEDITTRLVYMFLYSTVNISSHSLNYAVF